MRIYRTSALFLFCVSGCEPFEVTLDQASDRGFATETCCGGLGLCTADGFVPAEVAARLGQADCQTDTLLCAPLAWLLDPTNGPPRCRAADGAEGRCLLTCLPEVAPRAAQLSQGACSAGHVCAPCYDPATGEDTRACRFEPDPGPSEPPPAPCLTPR
jgi:hypothetical protein